MANTAVKLALLFTSDHQRFGRSWVYQYWHETEEALQPGYWGRAAGRLRPGDFVRLVRLGANKEVVEVTEMVVTKTSRDGVGLTVLHRHPIHRETTSAPPSEPVVKSVWNVGRKAYLVMVDGEEMAAYPDKESADAMIKGLLETEAA